MTTYRQEFLSVPIRLLSRLSIAISKNESIGSSIKAGNDWYYSDAIARALEVMNDVNWELQMVESGAGIFRRISEGTFSV